MGMEYRGEEPYVSGLSVELIAAAIGFAFVIALGKWLASRKERAMEAEPKA